MGWVQDAGGQGKGRWKCGAGKRCGRARERGVGRELGHHSTTLMHLTWSSLLLSIPTFLHQHQPQLTRMQVSQHKSVLDHTLALQGLYHPLVPPPLTCLPLFPANTTGTHMIACHPPIPACTCRLQSLATTHLKRAWSYAGAGGIIPSAQQGISNTLGPYTLPPLATLQERA